MINRLIYEKVIYYHVKSRERLGEIELLKQKRMHSRNIYRNILLTELTNAIQAINTAQRQNNIIAIYKEDKEFVEIMRDRMTGMLNSLNDGYY